MTQKAQTSITKHTMNDISVSAHDATILERQRVPQPLSITTKAG